MTPDEMVLQLIDMADCAQGWISEDNDHPDAIADSWKDAIRMAAQLSGSTLDVEELLPQSAAEHAANIVANNPAMLADALKNTRALGDL